MIDFSDDEQETPSRFRRSSRRTRNEDEEEAYVKSSPKPSSESEDSVSESEAPASSDEDEIIRAQRSKRLRAQEKARRLRSSSRRISESERLKSSFRSVDSDNNKQVEEDAALAAALAASYYSDDEKAVRVSRQPYNPYERPMSGYNRPPPRRSGRSAAMVSAARVAFYSSLFNPDANVHDLITPAEQQSNRYNLRSNRSTPTTTNHLNYDFLAEGLDPHTLLPDRLYHHSEDKTGPASSSNNPNNHNDDELLGEGQQASGTLSMSALDQIAGMDGYIKKLKEMIVFPLVYPHLFEKLNISLPRGVLFHGPPGTGKTLMARLLAEACSTSTRKVTFFMRNGSDCLSKWIGEAERNMRLLFKKAKECQPAIIFFDEIDGLAPERTGRQDQSHISLVSTLLALMDGLDDRGQVVVIGATNRIHSLDAALRRPGRFDREFFFDLPDEAARAQILSIHTKTWTPPIDDELARELASRTAGFSGADMKALCVEAALRSVQRLFPQVYHASKPVDSTELDASKVSVTAADFEHALLYMNPSTKRHSSRADLVCHQKPQLHLYSAQLSHLLGSLVRPVVKRTFAQNSSGKASWQVSEPLMLRLTYAPTVHPDAFIWRFMCGVAESLDGFTVQSVDLTAELTANSNESVEGAVWRVLSDARAKSPICVLFKSLVSLGGKTGRSVRATLQRFAQTLLPGEPVVVVYSVRCEQETVFKPRPYIKTFHLQAPTESQVREYRTSVLQTLYRMLAVDFLVPLSEEEFIIQASERLPSSNNVTALEQLRMCWTDELITNPNAFFVTATGSTEDLTPHATVQEIAETSDQVEQVEPLKDVIHHQEPEQESDSNSSDDDLPENVLFD